MILLLLLSTVCDMDRHAGSVTQSCAVKKQNSSRTEPRSQRNRRVGSLQSLHVEFNLVVDSLHPGGHIQPRGHIRPGVHIQPEVEGYIQPWGHIEPRGHIQPEIEAYIQPWGHIEPRATSSPGTSSSLGAASSPRVTSSPGI